MGNTKSKNVGGSLQENMVEDLNRSRHKRNAYNLTQNSNLLRRTNSGRILQANNEKQQPKYTKTAQHFSGGVAIKLFQGKITKGNSNTDFKTEAAILGKCDHPNIVKLFEITKVQSKISLVLELCDGGNVLERLPYQNESSVARIVKQVCSAVSYMHSKNIVHRDIECSNIMFATQKEDSEVKLVDFGSACELETIPNVPGAFKFLKEKTGSLTSMAPEVIQGKYGPKADIWSIGIVAYTLLNDGMGPFPGTTKEELEPKILQGKISYNDWKHSEEAKAFCQKTCKINERQRINAANTLYDPWIANNCGGTKYKVLPIELVTSFHFYQTALPLKRIALNVLARKVKSSKYREVFEQLDKGNSGMLTKEEFLEGFKNSGNSSQELHDLYDKLDINNNGGITYTEFIAATLEVGGELEEDRLREAFDLISSNRKYITPKDVESILSESLKDRDGMAKMTDMVDTQMKKFNKKHKEKCIDYEEFAQMFEHGFQNIHGMDAIIETSLNAEQLEDLKITANDHEKQMSNISEGRESWRSSQSSLPRDSTILPRPQT